MQLQQKARMVIVNEVSCIDMTTNPTPKQFEEYVWISKTVNVDIFASDVHPIIRRLEQAWGVKITIAESEGQNLDDEAFIQAIDEALERKVAGILIHGCGIPAEVDAINRAIEQGIPVVTINNDVPNSKRLAYIGTDWFRMGSAMADQLVSFMGDGGSVLCVGNTSLPNVQTGIRGFQQRMKNYPDVELVELENNHEHHAALAMTMKRFTQHPKIKGVVGFDFQSGLTIANLLQETHMAGKVKSICLDAEAPHITFVKNGTIQAAFSQRRKRLAYKAFQLLYDHNHGLDTAGHQSGHSRVDFATVTIGNADLFEDEFNLDEAIEHQKRAHQLAFISASPLKPETSSHEIGITDYKRAKAVIQQSEERLQQAVRIGKIGIFEHDHITNDLYWSSEQRQIFGWGVDEAAPTPEQFIALIHPDDVQRIGEAIQQAHNPTSDGLFDVEYRIIDRSGAIHWTKNRSRTLFEGEGENRHAVRTIGAVLDISEQKQTETALRQSEARYRALIESQNDLISRYRPDTVLTFVNDAYCQFYGKTRDELIGVSYLTMVAPEFHEVTLQEVSSIVKDLRPTSGEYLNYSADGKAHWIQWHIQPITDENGQVVELQAIGHDITQLKHTEESLRESEFFLQKSQTVGQVGSYYFDVRNNSWIDSPMLDEIFGIDDSFPKNTVGWLSLVHPDQQAEMSQYFSQHVLTERNRFEKEYRIIRRSDQQERWVYGLGELEFDEQGNPARMIGTIQDITERKQMEQDLRRSEARFRALVEHSPDYITFVNTDYQVLYINRISSGDTATVVGRNFLDFILPEYVDHVKQTFDTVVRSGKPGQYEAQIITALGTTWLETRIVPLIEGGQVTNVILVSTDIANRKRMEDALRQSEARYRSIVETAQEGIWLLDNQGITTYVNPKMAEILGYTVDEMMGRSMFDFMDESAISQAQKNLERRSMGINEQHEFRFKHKTGTDVWTTIATSAIMNEQGQFVAALGMVTDITERKQLEAHKQESEQMLHNILNTIPTRVFWKDRQYRLLGCNQKFVEDAGAASREALIGKADEELAKEPRPPWNEHVASYRADDRYVIETGKSLIGYEEKQIRGDGKTYWLRTTKMPLRNANGDIIGILGAYEDITERKHSELALQAKREEEQEFQRYLKILHDISIEVTMIDDLDEFYQQTIRLGLERFGFDRMGLWLYDAERNMALGTYGTDDKGNLQSEYHFQFTIEPWGGMWEALRKPDRFVYEETGDLMHNLEKVGTGWKVTIALWLGDRNLGWISVDNLIHGRPITRPQLDILAQYGLFMASSLARKQAEAALQASEERLRQAVRAGSIGIFDQDHVTGSIYWSEEQRQIWGWDLHETVTLEAIAKSIHPEDMAKVAADSQASYEPTGDGRFDLEHRIINRNGEIRWVSIHSQTQFKGTGSDRHPVRSVGATTDITERKRTEAILRESQQRFSKIFHSSPIGISVSRLSDNKIVDINEAGLNILGYNREELIGNSHLSLSNWGGPSERERISHEFQEKGRIRNYEVQAPTKSGDLRTVLISIESMNLGGEIYLLSSSLDITDRKRAEEALQESERTAREFQEKLKTLQEISLELAAAETIDLLCSRAIELGQKVLGYDRIGMEVFKDVSQVEATRYGINEAGELYVEYIPNRSAYGLITNDGLKSPSVSLIKEDTELYNSHHEIVGQGWNIITGLWDNETIIGWLAADNFLHHKPLIPYQVELLNLYGLTIGHLVVRKRREAEIHALNEELEQRVIDRTKELQEANEEIKQFAYIVSHDLRAPLVNLKGFAAELRAGLKIVEAGCDEVLPLIDQTTRKQLTGVLQEDIPEALRFIESSVTNMDTFTKAILKLSRLGRLQLELVKIDVKSLVEKTLDALSHQIRQQGVKVTVGDLPVITADVVSMEQIFGNILANAVIYLVPERPGEIEITAEADDDETIFCIRDNGRGIAKADMDKVFAPFRRAGKQNVPGEGMGLAYVQTLVRRHGGRIWCDSKEGVGTTFSFGIPRNLTNDSPMP